MHSDTLKLALNPEHENENARYVHVVIFNGKRIAYATDMRRAHFEDCESAALTHGKGLKIRDIIVPESELRAVQPPELAAVLYAEQLGEKCLETENRALRAELEKARAAVTHVLTRIRDVPELYWHMGAMTEAERLLFAAYSAQHGIPVAEVKKRFAPEPAAYNRWCDEREDADRLIAIGREHDTEGKGAAE